jgi:hypothetical protein
MQRRPDKPQGCKVNVLQVESISWMTEVDRECMSCVGLCWVASVLMCGTCFAVLAILGLGPDSSHLFQITTHSIHQCIDGRPRTHSNEYARRRQLSHLSRD